MFPRIKGIFRRLRYGDRKWHDATALRDFDNSSISVFAGTRGKARYIPKWDMWEFEEFVNYSVLVYPHWLHIE